MSNYRVDSAAAGAGDGDPWSDAFTTITAALSGRAATDVLWVAPAHAVTAGAAITWACPSSAGLKILGVNSNTTDPASALNSTPTAYEAVGASSNPFNVNGYAFVQKMKLIGGTNASASCDLVLHGDTSPAAQVYQDCAFEIPSTSTGASLLLGQGASTLVDQSKVNLKGCTIKFGATGQSIFARHARITLEDFGVNPAGSTPTTLFKVEVGLTGSLLCRDSNLADVSWSNLCDVSTSAPYDATFIDDKFPSGFAFSTGTHAGPGGISMRCHRCASGDSQIGFYELTGAGSVTEDTGIYVSGDDMTLKLTPSSHVSFPDYPLITRQRIPVAAADTGSSQSITVKMDTDRSTALTNADVAVRVHYLGTSGTSLGSIATSEAADVFATPSTLTSNADSWTGTSGFTNEQKREITVSFTPQEAGDIEIEVCVFAALTNPLYVAMPVALD